MKLPEFYDTVKTLDQTVDVDYYLPGCPPPTKLIAAAIDAIASNNLPPKGSVLAPLKAVCDECPRKRDNKKIGKIYRVYENHPIQIFVFLNKVYSVWGLQQEAVVVRNV